MICKFNNFKFCFLYTMNLHKFFHRPPNLEQLQLFMLTGFEQAISKLESDTGKEC